MSMVFSIFDMLKATLPSSNGDSQYSYLGQINVETLQNRLRRNDNEETLLREDHLLLYFHLHCPKLSHLWRTHLVNAALFNAEIGKGGNSADVGGKDSVC